MKNILTRKHNAAIGIDISGSSVKLVQLRHSKGAYYLDAFARVSLPTGAVVEKEIRNVQEVVNTIKKAMNLSQVSQKVVCTAIADSSIVTRVIEVEKGLSDLELEALVMHDADENIPYPLDEIYIDYYLIPNKQSVFIAAAPKDIVDKYTEVLLLAGLKPLVIDAESFVMRRACQCCIEGFDKYSTLATIDLGSSRTTFVVYHNDFPIFTQTEMFGCEFLAKDVSTEALELVKPKQKEDKQLYKQFKKEAIEHIKATLQTFYSNTQNAYTLEKIILSGSAMAIEGFADMIQDELQIATETANPMKKLNLNPKLDSRNIMHHSKSLMIALGSARRGMDV